MLDFSTKGEARAVESRIPRFAASDLRRSRQPVFALVHPIMVNFDDPQHGLPSPILFPNQHRQRYLVHPLTLKKHGVSSLNPPSSSDRTGSGGPVQKPVSEEPSTIMRKPDLLYQKHATKLE